VNTMLFEIAIGDAYGAGLEYVHSEIVTAHNNLSGYVKHPRHPLPAGWYTDDTQMSIAVAEAMLCGVPWTRELLAAKFVEVFKRDPREGYAPGFYQFLCEIHDADEFLARIRPDSDKSGAAMRATPIGLLPDLAQVIESCTLQAKLTHDTPDGTNAAVAAAVATHYLAYGLGPKHEVGRFVAERVPGRWDEPWEGRVKLKGWMSVRAAITALQRNDRMSDLLRHCIAFGGDVDTVAAIAMGAACCCREIEPDVPEVLADGLEDRTYGKRYLRELDQQFQSLFPDLRIVN
jgi:ADP-ribosyl-[dinitrogen reductase] hydrolase